MKRFISLVLLLSVSMNVMARSGSIKALEREIDSYHYTMSVEWDQRDKAFQELARKKFLTHVERIMVEEAIAPKEAEALILKKMGSSKEVKSIQEMLAVKPLQTTEEIAAFVNQHSSSLYSSGASWNGNADSMLMIGGIIAGLIATIALIKWASGPGPECVRYRSEDYCIDRYDYNGYLESWDCGVHQVCDEYKVNDPR